MYLLKKVFLPFRKEVGDGPEAAEDLIQEGIPNNCAVPDSSVQANVQLHRRRSEEGSLLQ